MSSATATIIPEKSQASILAFSKECYSQLNRNWNIRYQMAQTDLAYLRETDRTNDHVTAQILAAAGNPTKFQNVTVPIVMPQVEAAVTYQASVFLTGTPIFGWVAPPEQASAALQYQAIVEENSIRGAWVQQFMIFFRDCFKYNIGMIECAWDRQVTAAIETDLAFTGGQEGKPKEVIWEGNCVNRWDPYNTFFDTRYKPTEIYKHGEFVGRTELMSRIHLKKFINELPDKMISNVVRAFESTLSEGPGIESYYIPQLNPRALLLIDPKATTDWRAWAEDKASANSIQYSNVYEITTLYARIMPSDFNLRLPSANTPQVWKFIIVNHSVLIYAERQTNAHNYLPVLFGQPNEDGLGYQTKSLAENARPFQEIASALVNSAMAARRRAISDRGIYNPSLVSAAHMNSDSPTAKIPMRPAGYNKLPSEAYFPIPFRDDQSAIAFQELPQITQMANIANGQNPAKQGQFVKGNKTLHEYSDVQAHANGRDQMTAMLLEGQVFTPLKEIIKINTLQYQAGTSLYSPAQERMVKIDPVELRNSFATYKISDGLAPTDKVISGEEFAVALQAIGSSPQIGAGYNIAPAFSYLMKTRNVDLSPFEKSPQQLAYEQAVGAWQQAMMEMKDMMSKMEPEQMQEMMAKMPQQPMPEQFGYVPGAPAAKQGNPQAGGTPGANLTQAATARQGA